MNSDEKPVGDRRLDVAACDVTAVAAGIETSIASWYCDAPPTPAVGEVTVTLGTTKSIRISMGDGSEWATRALA